MLLGDYVAVAWSKSYRQAADVISTLSPLAAMGPIDSSFLESALTAIEPERKNDLSYIVCGIDAQGLQHLFWHDAIGPNNIGPMGEVVCAGSGTRTFLDIASQFSGNVLLLNPTAATQEFMQGFDIGFVAALAGEEFSSPAGLQDGWGGGYEIIREDAGRFRKTGGTLNLFFSVSEHESNSVSVWWHSCFRHTDYWRGLTVVQAIEHEIRNGQIVDAGRHDVFLVTAPGLDNVPIVEFVPPNINHYDCVLTSLISSNKEESLVYASAWETPVFRYSFQNDRVHVSFNNDFIRSLIAEVENRYKRRANFVGCRPSPFVQHA